MDCYGRIDGLVVNAGGPPAGRFDNFEEADWYNAFELTLMSAVRMVRAVFSLEVMNAFIQRLDRRNDKVM